MDATARQKVGGDNRGSDFDSPIKREGMVFASVGAELEDTVDQYDWEVVGLKRRFYLAVGSQVVRFNDQYYKFGFFGWQFNPT